MKMDWQRLIYLACVVWCVSTQSSSGPKLRLCQSNLKGYVFENTETERCYEFLYAKEDRKSWSEAQRYCQVNSGRMINIENKEKQDMLEFFLNSKANTYKPDITKYDPLDNKTWNGYDPDVFIGAMRDSDGSTWRFDQFATSRTVSSLIVTWFNYGTDPVLIAEQNAEKNRYKTDTCLVMRFNYESRLNDDNVTSYYVRYPWYQRQLCSNSKFHQHPYICEYIGYEYRETPPTSNWVIVIGVLGVFVGCGFIACTIYCLWDKIHTSYNVLQV